MRKEELRIGNYVFLLPSKAVRIVEMISKKSIGFSNLGGKLINDNYSPIEEFESIPITEKWLKSFGFKEIKETVEDWVDTTWELETKNVYFRYSDDWSVAIAGSKSEYENTSNYITTDISIANKVHLLQNLYFALCGEELKSKQYEEIR